MIESSPYIRIRFPREQRFCHVTLSLPGGVERALQQGSLTDSAEALLPEIGSWVPLAEHPEVAPIVASQAGLTGWRKRLAGVSQWAAAL